VEIETALATRVYAISAPAEIADPDYLEGLRHSLTTAFDHTLAALQVGEQRAPEVPPALLVQARMAARTGVSLDIVLRRYFAGYALLSEFIIAEAEDGGLLQGTALTQLLFGQAAVFDRLVAAVSEEHAREAACRPASSEERRAERVRRLLDGELIDTSELGYDLEVWHTAVIAQGSGSSSGIRKLAAALDASLLLVSGEPAEAWVWLGSRRPLAADLQRLCRSTSSPAARLAIGEAAAGVDGWRLTHRQARAALSVAKRTGDRIARYADVALLASMIQDDLLLTSLRGLYLEPLQGEADGGEALCAALSAYFRSGRNASSAAAALGVNRRTLSKRLRTVEEILGRPLDSVAAEIEAALRLRGLDLAVQS
jgi:hypothetical protein